MKYKTVHKGCGGEVRKRKCLKCGKKWGIIGYTFTGNTEEKAVKFDEKEYRKRIQEKRDIFQ